MSQVSYNCVNSVYFVGYVNIYWNHINMTSISEETIYNIIEKIALGRNLKNWRCSQEKFESIAQNYFGVIIPVVLTGEENGKLVSLKLALKLAPMDERYRVSGAVTRMFAREIYVYSVIFKKYEEIQKNVSFTSSYIMPHCYYICKEYCKEVIAMQNMCGEDFKPFTSDMFLNLEHISIALKSLAKLHALSYILKAREQTFYEEISKECLPLTIDTNKRYIDIMLDRLGKAIKKFEDSEYAPLFESLRENCAKCFEVVVSKGGSTCICHGDIWKENILFKYENGIPTSACLIDYQTTRICSPAFDTLYLIISSTDSHLRKDHYNNLLDTYYHSFDQMLKEASLNSANTYSRQMFDQDLELVWPACLITANTALWLSSGLQEEGHVRSKKVWSTPEEKERASNSYKQIIKAIIDDFSCYGYLDLKSNCFCF
ncbi:uncharacterized protein LOC115448243 [Manduca sexta]|uniref:CHK kinase-like domain-containing protein n=1 Tax=Manduca sexta TaxID=7130 RepID=A0A922CTG4_MANSE|nr:uncharacterized protein LOC115448243 [Manduca sexta]KAG6457551.1 hypothetical protein O3G_MSEX010348 [Manduca sexta]